MHNYYEDYTLQYKADRNAGLQPTLSEMGVQGLSYCVAVLNAASHVHRGFYIKGEKVIRPSQPGQWMGAADAINKARILILKNKPSEALAVTNPLRDFSLPFALSDLRREFLDLDFGSSLEREIRGAMSAQDTGSPSSALKSAFPKLQSAASLLRFCEQTNTVANRRILSAVPLSANLERGAVLLTAHNPLFTIIHGINLPYRIAEMPQVSAGRVTAGRPTESEVFTPESAFTMDLTHKENNTFPLLRRLRRGASRYVFQFDIFLTYLTDLCRILECTLPEESRGAALTAATRFSDIRMSSHISHTKE